MSIRFMVLIYFALLVKEYKTSGIGYSNICGSTSNEMEFDPSAEINAPPKEISAPGCEYHKLCGSTSDEFQYDLSLENKAPPSRGSSRRGHMRRNAIVEDKAKSILPRYSDRNHEMEVKQVQEMFKDKLNISKRESESDSIGTKKNISKSESESGSDGMKKNTSESESESGSDGMKIENRMENTTPRSLRSKSRRPPRHPNTKRMDLTESLHRQNL